MVYLELNGGRARKLGLDDNRQAEVVSTLTSVAKARPTPLGPLSTDEERDSHAAFITRLGENMIWNRYK